MSNQWLVRTSPSAKSQGPVSQDRLRTLYQEGKLKDQHELSEDGTVWNRVENCSWVYLELLGNGSHERGGEVPLQSKSSPHRATASNGGEEPHTILVSTTRPETESPVDENPFAFLGDLSNSYETAASAALSAPANSNMACWFCLQQPANHANPGSSARIMLKREISRNYKSVKFQELQVVIPRCSCCKWEHNSNIKAIDRKATVIGAVPAIPFAILTIIKLAMRPLNGQEIMHAMIAVFLTFGIPFAIARFLMSYDTSVKHKNAHPLIMHAQKHPSVEEYTTQGFLVQPEFSS